MNSVINKYSVAIMIIFSTPLLFSDSVYYGIKFHEPFHVDEKLEGFEIFGNFLHMHMGMYELRPSLNEEIANLLLNPNIGTLQKLAVSQRAASNNISGKNFNDRPSVPALDRILAGLHETYGELTKAFVPNIDTHVTGMLDQRSIYSDVPLERVNVSWGEPLRNTGFVPFEILTAVAFHLAINLYYDSTAAMPLLYAAVQKAPKNDFTAPALFILAQTQILNTTGQLWLPRNEESFFNDRLYNYTQLLNQSEEKSTEQLYVFMAEALFEKHPGISKNNASEKVFIDFYENTIDSYNFHRTYLDQPKNSIVPKPEPIEYLSSVFACKNIFLK